MVNNQGTRLEYGISTESDDGPLIKKLREICALNVSRSLAVSDYKGVDRCGFELSRGGWRHQHSSASTHCCRTSAERGRVTPGGPVGTARPPPPRPACQPWVCPALVSPDQVAQRRAGSPQTAGCGEYRARARHECRRQQSGRHSRGNRTCRITGEETAAVVAVPESPELKHGYGTVPNSHVSFETYWRDRSPIWA